MYIPQANSFIDRDEIVAFMKAYSFASIVTTRNNLPQATHLPFLISERDGNLILTSHFAKANKQWGDIEQNNILTIFSGPHAYISPSNYNSSLSVPTWNYVSVHIYGQGRIVSDTRSVFEIMETTINTYEQAYLPQWSAMPEEYKLKMFSGIVAFEIVVSEVQAKKKLSQNKSREEQERIITSLQNSKDSNVLEIASLMRNQLAE